MDNLYTRIEDGTADEYGLERLMTAIKTKRLELESKGEVTSEPEQIFQVPSS